MSPEDDLTMRELQFLVPTRLVLAMDEMRGEGESRSAWIRRALDDLLAAGDGDPPSYRMSRTVTKTRIYFDIDPERNERLQEYQRRQKIGNAGTVLRLAIVRRFNMIAEANQAAQDLELLEQEIDADAPEAELEMLGDQIAALRNRLSAIRAQADL